MFRPVFPEGMSVRLAHENEQLRKEIEELGRKVSELACVVHPLLAYGQLIDATPPQVTCEDPTGK